VDGDDFNRRLLETLNDAGQIYLTHTKIDGTMILRMSIGAASTTREHVERAWSIIQSTAAAIQAEGT
jgi:aromatic-L-amino-acid decarboxylase